MTVKFRISLIILLCLGITIVARPGAPVNPPPGMVYVPGGKFLMGSELYNPDERPARVVKLEGYYIDKKEVTFGDYMDCVKDGKCRRPRLGKSAGRDFPAPRDNWPVVGVNWHDARNYCKWKHKRLPTEAEWEKAARGNTGNPYPWGDVVDCDHANYKKCRKEHPVAAGSYPRGKSPYGAMDMAGNAQEWVADWYDSDYYKDAPDENPSGPSSGEKKVLRSGSYDYVWSAVRTTYRYSDFPENHDNSYGFRCAANR